MTPARKGVIAATTFAAVHIALVAGAVTVLRSGASSTPVSDVQVASVQPAAPTRAPEPAASPNRPSASQASAQADADQKRQAEKAVGKATHERKAAMAFLNHIARGEHADAYALLSEQARDSATVDSFETTFAPLTRVGMTNINWTRINVENPSTKLIGWAAARNGQVELELRIVHTSEGCRIDYFRFKSEAKVRTASR